MGWVSAQGSSEGTGSNMMLTGNISPKLDLILN